MGLNDLMYQLSKQLAKIVKLMVHNAMHIAQQLGVSFMKDNLAGTLQEALASTNGMMNCVGGQQQNL